MNRDPIEEMQRFQKLQASLNRSRRRVRDLRLVLRQLASYIRNHSPGREVVHEQTKSRGCTCGLDDTLERYFKVMDA